MENILLLMRRRPIAQAIINSFKDKQERCPIYEQNYKNAGLTIINHNPKAVLIEVAESGPYDVGYCLELCKEIRRKMPECKLVLMCLEKNERSVEEVVAAKEEEKIDDFVFYDVTIDYLTSKLISI